MATGEQRVLDLLLSTRFLASTPVNDAPSVVFERWVTVAPHETAQHCIVAPRIFCMTGSLLFRNAVPAKEGPWATRRLPVRHKTCCTGLLTQLQPPG
jgi:hypothetical protein